MGVLAKIVEKFKGSGCEKLVKRTMNKIKISAGA